MNHKLHIFALCILLASISLNSFAKNGENSFQVAVIEESLGAKEILNGDYFLGLEKLGHKGSENNQKFETLLGRCAARIMTRELKQALLVCTDAIESDENRFGYKRKYLKSVAYSNRAIVHYLLGNTATATSDLKKAASINKNHIVMENLAKLQSRTSSSSESLVAEMAE